MTFTYTVKAYSYAADCTYKRGGGGNKKKIIIINRMLVIEHACKMVCIHMHTAKEKKINTNNQHNNTTSSHIIKYIKNKYK